MTNFKWWWKLWWISRNKWQPNLPYICDHPYRILIISGSGSDKNNALLNLTKNQWPDFDKIYLYVKDSFESNYQLLINRRGKARIKKIKESKGINWLFTNDNDIYQNLENNNPVFDDM